MVRFPEAAERLFRNKFVCRRCKAVVKSPNMKIIQGKVSCRGCGYDKFKAKRKK
ncbi:hypothetical protein HY642_06735 [Candidatus Woesearchaeota archaeon]|nr:hypothetical protein [Candidatus Woesearchaeota archaeon]